MSCIINVQADNQYVSRLNSRTTLKSTWDMVRRISGKYKANTVSHFKSNNNGITDVKEICNTLAAQFVFNSSSDNFRHMFNRHRLTVERKTIDFDTNDHYSYNDVFTLHELKQAIIISRDTSPGIDTVHYHLLKHLPDDSMLLLLYFLSDRYFKVRVGNIYSDPHSQEAGVPQGSILTVTFFSLKINSIVSCLLLLILNVPSM